MKPAAAAPCVPYALDRRAFMAIAGGLLAAPLVAGAQQAGKVYRIGLLGPEAPPDPYTTALRASLRRLGYVEGQNVLIEDRWAEGKVDRLASLAADLARLRVELIVAVSTPAALAAKDATSTIPVVFAYVGDPVRDPVQVLVSRRMSY
jgi:putative ABC transport system substrate-binding protein